MCKLGPPLQAILLTAGLLCFHCKLFVVTLPVGLEGEGTGEGCHESARAGPTQRVDRCASSSRLRKGPRPTRYVVVPVDRVGARFEAEQAQAQGIGWVGAGREGSGGQT